MSGRLTHAPLDATRLLALVQAPARGGTCVFLGTVRPDDGAVAIEYSAHEPLAEAELERIVEETRARWPEAAVALEHRLGRIAAGAPSVVVAAAAPHRAQAFEACRYVIEQVKARLPVWKREERADGTARWVDNEGRKVDSPGPARA